MSYIVQLPKLNNIQFVPEGYTPSLGSEYLPLDKDWYKNNIRHWQVNKPYRQKIQQDDKQCIVLHREDENDVYFQIFDTCGNLVDISGAGYTDSKVQTTYSIYDANSVYKNQDGTQTQLSVHVWSFYWSDFNLPDGIYFIRLYVEFFDGMSIVETKTQISEPLHVKTEWEDTILIKATNDTNRQHVIFNYDTSTPSGWTGFVFKPVFSHRVEGSIAEYAFNSNDNFFTEQDEEVRNLNPQGWLSKFLQIGGSQGIPAYTFDKINHVLCADNISIEGRRIEKSDGATFSMSESKTRALYNGEIEIQDYSFQDEISDTRGAKILFFEEGSGAYYVYSAGFAQIPVILYAGAYVPDSTARDALVTSLNTTYATFYQLEGTFTAESGGVYYQNADNETYTATPAKVIDQYFDIDITISNNNDSFAMTFINGTAPFYGGVVWGDTNTENVSNPAGNVSDSKEVIHEYSSSGSYTVRVFPVFTLTGFSLLRHKHDAVIDDISGDLPLSMQDFTILANSADFSGLVSGLDLSFLANCRKTIRNFSITYSGLVGFDGDIFSQYPAVGITGNPADWKYLIGISFYKSAITSAEVEGFIVDFYDFTPKVSPIFMELRQNPAAPVTNTPATTYKANLIAAGGTVLTD